MTVLNAGFSPDIALLAATITSQFDFLVFFFEGGGCGGSSAFKTVSVSEASLTLHQFWRMDVSSAWSALRSNP